MEIEPHPDLVKYYEITHEFRSSFPVNHFFTNGEHYNIVSDIERNIFLMRRLNDLGLLKVNTRVCDCGLGLGNALFDFYLQSKEIEGKTFQFTGIEKHTEYTDFVSERLMQLWQTELLLINGDIMDQDYSKYDLVYSYSPFNNKKQLDKFYRKIVEESKPGTIIIEHANNGYGHLGVLENTPCLSKIDLDDQVIFIKG
jgi:hypothetical protein